MYNSVNNSVESRNERRTVIIDGYKNGLTNENIAAKLGVNSRVVRRDVKRMLHTRDQELREALRTAKEKVLEKKLSIANRPGERFLRETGMTFQEKTFSNMMSFYNAEIRKILMSNKQGVAIRALPGSVARTLRRNGIIARGFKTPLVTQKARAYLANSRFNS
jgi:transposase